MAGKLVTLFLSHAWEDPEIEAILDGFVVKLRTALANPPARWRGVYQVTLWFDRGQMRGDTTFHEQTDRACAAAPVALFALSDRWFGSPACQREAGFFCNAKGVEKLGKAYLLLQLRGRRDKDEARFADRPHYPEHLGFGHRNLLEVWDSPKAADRDELVAALAKEIFAALDRIGVPGAAP